MECAIDNVIIILLNFDAQITIWLYRRQWISMDYLNVMLPVL